MEMPAYGQVRERSLESCRVQRVCAHVRGSTPAVEPVSTLKGHLVSLRRQPGAIQTPQYNLINSPKGPLLICAALGGNEVPAAAGWPNPTE